MCDVVGRSKRFPASRLATTLLASVWLTVLALPALASATVAPDGPIVGGTYRLASGETIVGEVTSIGADVTLAEGSVVAGRMNIVGGTLDVRGHVNGVIHMYFGELSLADTAYVEGSVYGDWAAVNRAEGAVVTNAYEVGGAPVVRFSLPAGTETTVTAASRVVAPESTWGLLARAIALALFTALATAIMPDRLIRIAAEASERPLRSGAFGLTIVVTAAVAIVLFVLTIVGIPVALAIGALVWLGATVGIAALARGVGGWLERTTDRSSSPSLMYAAIGGLVVGLVLGSLEWLPVLGGLVEAGVSLVGLGAVAASRIGSSRPSRTPSPSVTVETAG